MLFRFTAEYGNDIQKYGVGSEQIQEQTVGDRELELWV